MVQNNGFQYTHAQKLQKQRAHFQLIFMSKHFQFMRTSYLIQAQHYQNNIKHTFPDLIRLVGRESQEIVSVTLLLTVAAEGTGPVFPVCFAGELSFVGEVLAGIGELL